MSVLLHIALCQTNIILSCRRPPVTCLECCGMSTSSNRQRTIDGRLFRRRYKSILVGRLKQRFKNVNFLQPRINISWTTTFRSVTAYILEVAFLIAGGTDIRWRLSTGNSAAISTFPVYIFGLQAGICCILFAHDNTSLLKLNFGTDYYKHFLE